MAFAVIVQDNKVGLCPACVMKANLNPATTSKTTYNHCSVCGLSLPNSQKVFEEECEELGWNNPKVRWEKLFAKVAPHTTRVLLWGPPGTAKTSTAHQHGLASKREVYNITLTLDTAVQELVGHFVPRGGEFVWHDGPAIRAWRSGGLLVLNELSEASGPVLTALYGLLDDPGVAQLTLPSGETVKPKEGFMCVATTNEEPKLLPTALRDRFDVTIHASSPTRDQLRSLPRQQRRFLVNVYGSSAARDPVTFPSFRRVKSFTALAKELDEDTAAQVVFGNQAGEFLRELKLV